MQFPAAEHDDDDNDCEISSVIKSLCVDCRTQDMQTLQTKMHLVVYFFNDTMNECELMQTGMGYGAKGLN